MDQTPGANEQEFVIGVTLHQPAHGSISARFVGYYEKKKLLFAGKVGSGFDDKLLAILYRKFRAEVAR